MKITLIKDGNEIDKMLAPTASLFEGYEEFWSNYIGCQAGDGLESTGMKISGISPDQDLLRRLIGQWNYSILLDYFHLNQLIPHMPDFETKTFTTLERTYILSVHIYSNAVDCIEKIYNKLNRSRQDPVFIKNFKLFRNIFVHDIRPLIYIKAKIYNVLSPEAFETLKPYERGHFVWSDLNKAESNYIPLSTFIDRLKSNILSEFNLILPIELKEFTMKQMPKIQPSSTSPIRSRPAPSATFGPKPSASISDNG